MNTQKLNELAAIHCMGWVKKSEPSAWLPQLGDDEYWEGQAGEGRISVQKWNPCGDLNDASALLEKVANGEEFRIKRVADDRLALSPNRKYGCLIYPNDMRYEKTLPLAMTICALRFSGIPESSITEATKDE